jgi:hypothetical protein
VTKRNDNLVFSLLALQLRTISDLVRWESFVFKVESSYHPYLCSCCDVWFFSEKLLSRKIAWMCSDCATASWLKVVMKQAVADT